MAAPLTDRGEAERLDAADPLRGLRAAFEIADPEPIYLDGNSLGRLPKATLERVSGLIRDEWGRDGVRRWADWIDLPMQVGDKIASAFLGAGPGEVVIGDSTTVNLYRLADAALDGAARSARHRRLGRRVPDRPLRPAGPGGGARPRAPAHRARSGRRPADRPTWKPR